MIIKKLLFKIVDILGINGKAFEIHEEEIPVFDTKNTDVYLNLRSSNNLLEINDSNQITYFRFINQVQCSPVFLISMIERFESWSNENWCCIKQILKTKSCRARFLNMGDFSVSSPIYSYFKGGDFVKIGLDDTLLSYHKRQSIDTFLQYAWSEICTHKKNRHSGAYQSFSYCRSKCQQEIYELFGVSRLMCPIKLVKLKGASSSYLGSIQQQAQGINPLSYAKGQLADRLSPIIIRDLNIMNILDVLCNERDHRPGNYNIVLNEEGLAVSIQSFDNDSDLSFFPFFNIDRPLRGCPGLVNSEGLIYLKNMDGEFVERFLKVSSKELKDVVKPYLNVIQTHALITRFNKIKTALTKTIKCNPNFLKYEEESWTSLDLEAELESKCLNYTSLLCSWYEGDKDPVILRQNNWNKIKINL